MSSISDALRKQRPPVATAGQGAPAPMPPPRQGRFPSADRALVTGRSGDPLYDSMVDPLGDSILDPPPPLPSPPRGGRATSVVGLGLLFALSVAAGAALALRPPGAGQVEARPSGADVVDRVDGVDEVDVVDVVDGAMSIASTMSTPSTPSTMSTVSVAPVFSPEPIHLLPARRSPEPVHALPEVLYESDFVERTPFRRVAAPPSRGGALPRESAPEQTHDEDGDQRLEGIFWSSDRPLALIGDQIAAEGDRTSLGRIIQINPKNIIVERDGRRRTIPL